MNCAVGDLAVVVYDDESGPSSFIGAFCRVLRFAGVYQHQRTRAWMPGWAVDFGRDMPWGDHVVPPMQKNVGWWPDAWLHPIRDAGATDDGITTERDIAHACNRAMGAPSASAYVSREVHARHGRGRPPVLKTSPDAHWSWPIQGRGTLLMRRVSFAPSLRARGGFLHRVVSATLLHGEGPSLSCAANVAERLLNGTQVIAPAFRGSPLARGMADV